VLPLVLVALIGFATHMEHFLLITNTESLDVVLHILQHYDLPFKRLAGEGGECAGNNACQGEGKVCGAVLIMQTCTNKTGL
jgi:hypothetical protein